eukprot:2775030-Rhodomonas_salina.7
MPKREPFKFDSCFVICCLWSAQPDTPTQFQFLSKLADHMVCGRNGRSCFLLSSGASPGGNCWSSGMGSLCQRPVSKLLLIQLPSLVKLRLTGDVGAGTMGGVLMAVFGVATASGMLMPQLNEKRRLNEESRIKHLILLFRVLKFSPSSGSELGLGPRLWSLPCQLEHHGPHLLPSYCPQMHLRTQHPSLALARTLLLRRLLFDVQVKQKRAGGRCDGKRQGDRKEQGNHRGVTRECGREEASGEQAREGGREKKTTSSGPSTMRSARDMP